MDFPKANLAISLHAPSQQIRKEIVPSNASELSKLFNDRKIEKNICINLIPYNPTDIGNQHKFEPPTDKQLEAFKQIVIENGIFCTIRKSTTSGRDVDGACGQLVLRGKDIEDIIPQKIKNKRKKRMKMTKKSQQKESTAIKAFDSRKAMIMSASILTITVASYCAYSYNKKRTESRKG